MSRPQAEAAVGAMKAAFDDISSGEAAKSAARLLRAMSIPESFLAQVSEAAARYLAAIEKVETVPISDIQVLGGTDVITHSRATLPGCVVSRIGFVPIAAEQDGAEYCLDIVHGRIYLLPFEWFDDVDPLHLREVYSPERGILLERRPLTLENVIARDPITITSPEMFLETVVPVAFDD